MKHKPTQRGFALIYALWTLAFLSLLGVGILRVSRLEMRIAHYDKEQIELRWIAKAGVEKAIAILKGDSTSYDASLDDWYDNEQSLQNLIVGSGKLNVHIQDESGKLNINVATQQQLEQLPNMTDELVAAILDWRDHNMESRPSGVEAEYYNDLQPPYPIRNGPFRSLKELLLVKGMTPEIFYGEDLNLNQQLDANENDGSFTEPKDNQDDQLNQGLAAHLTCYSYHYNTDTYGNDKLNINEASEKDLTRKLELPEKYAKWIKEKHRNAKSIGALIDERSPETPERAASGKSVPIDLETYKKIFNLITVSDDGKQFGLVNINTASLEVFKAICEGDEQLATQLYQFRVRNVLPITSLTELIDDPGIGIAGFKKVVDKLSVNSHVFQTTSTATSRVSNARYLVSAYLNREESGTEIIYWHQGSLQ